MTDSQDLNMFAGIINLIYNSIVPDPHPKTFASPLSRRD